MVAEKHEALAAASGQGFNLFAILGRETDEVQTHSAILAELLDPQGSHRQGPAFARLFAKRFDIPTERIESAGVWPELSIDKESRIDIVMQTDDICVVVENKIYADDQSRQLERYHAYAKEWDSHKVFYLTLHGLAALESAEAASIPLKEVNEGIIRHAHGTGGHKNTRTSGDTAGLSGSSRTATPNVTTATAWRCCSG